MNAPDGPSLIGRQVAGYRVEELIGRGGMATVYRAFDLRLGRQVALKVLTPQLALDERFRQRFVRESRLVAGLDHPHIIPIYEADEADELLFIAMRYVEGRDLRALLDAEGPLSLARANRILSQVAAALDTAHHRGLVHRDVKPANILISGTAGDEHVYLSDFGLTKYTDSLSGLTGQGQFVGTPRYIAPEQITGDPVDGRCDEYALGCVAYEILTGVPPFQRDTQLALLYAHVSEVAAPVTSYRAELTPAIDVVLARALAKTPRARYEGCLEFVHALRDVISTGSSVLTRESGFGQADTVPPATGRLPSGPVTTDQPRSGWLRRLSGVRLAVLAGSIGLIVALLAVLAVVTGGPGTKRYPGSTAVPFSFAYPGSWQARTHADIFAVVSPAADRFEALLQTPVSADWTQLNRLVSGDPGQAQAIFAGVNDTLSTTGTPQAIQQSLQSLLPGKVDYMSSPASLTVGGRPAVRVDGVVSDPEQGGKLEFSSYIMQLRGEPAAFLTFFCAPAHCHPGQNQSSAESVTFTS
jgi:serine/threonine-protein kinase